MESPKRTQVEMEPLKWTSEMEPSKRTRAEISNTKRTRSKNVKRQRSLLSGTTTIVAPIQFDLDYFCEIELPMIIASGDWCPPEIAQMMVRRLDAVFDFIPVDLKISDIKSMHDWLGATGLPLQCTLRLCITELKALLLKP